MVPDGITASGIQKWIRGSGLFRRMAVFMETGPLTDAHWQGITLVESIDTITPITVQVVKPSSTLAADMDPFTPLPTFGSGGPPLSINDGDTPPVGVWTFLCNPNNAPTVTVSFAEAFTTIAGRNGLTDAAINASASPSVPYTFTLPANRMALLVYIGTNKYYLRIW